MSGWETYVRKVEPYVPGEQPKRKVIKLNTNENPYPPSPRVQKVLDGFDAEELRLYPDPEAAELIEAIALEKGLSKDQIFVGVGSDDVLAMSFLTFFGSDKPILFPDITYSFYDVWAELFRIPYVQIPLQEDFRICIEDYKRENGGIVIPNPNAPTGIAESLDAIEEILKTNPDSVVIIDEAYVDFGTKSALALLPKYENLLVVQTFSKSRSLAGSRIGYAMGCPTCMFSISRLLEPITVFPFAGSAAAYGNVLAYAVVVADFACCLFALELQVLRFGAYAGTRKKLVAVSYSCSCVYGDTII